MPHRITVLLALVVAAGGACSDEKPQVVETFVHDLRPGDCFNGRARPPGAAAEGERTALVVDALPCSERHDKEVFAIFEHPARPGGPFPGEREVGKVAQDGCAERFPGYVGHPFEDSEFQVSVIAPGPVPWDENDRTIVCALQGDKPLKGSKKADAD